MTVQTVKCNSSKLNHALGTVLTTLNHYSEAKLLYQQALALWEKLVGREDPLLAYTLDHLAGVFNYEGKYIQARTYANRALKIREKTLGPKHHEVAESLTRLAITYRHQHNYPKAEQLFQRALAIKEKVFGQEHIEVANTLDSLGRLYFQQGKYAKSEVLYERAIAIYEKVFGPEYPHPQLAEILRDYAMVLRMTKRKAEAAELEARAETIQAKLAQEKITDSE